MTMVLTTMGLAGRLVGATPALATLPLSMVPVMSMLTTVPAAHLMRRYGRGAGFLLGALMGVVGASVCALAMWQQHFYLLCLGASGLGIMNGFATYYRFTAAEVV